MLFTTCTIIILCKLFIILAYHSVLYILWCSKRAVAIKYGEFAGDPLFSSLVLSIVNLKTLFKIFVQKIYNFIVWLFCIEYYVYYLNIFPFTGTTTHKNFS